MPGFVKSEADETLWSAAKNHAGKKGKESNWALANYIFHKAKDHSKKEKKNVSNK